MDDTSTLLDKLTTPADCRANVNNAYFNRWNRRIINHVATRDNGVDADGEKNMEYHGPDLALLSRCMEHADKHSKPLDSENVLVLVHPLYMFLSDWNGLDSFNKIDAHLYFQSMSRLFANRRSLDANFVVFDTLHHYADSSSRLLEEGLIDRVFFTKYDTGVPNDMSYEHHLAGKNLFFGGGYDKRCLAHTTQDILALNHKSNWCITSLVLGAPKKNSSLRTNHISNNTDTYIIPPALSMYLDEFFDRCKKI